MSGRPILLGGGALARDMLELFGADTFSAVFVDPGFESELQGALPTITEWSGVSERADRFVLAVSGIEHRQRLVRQAQQWGLQPAAPLVSPRAVVARDAEVAEGCAIGHHVVIGPKARLDRHVLVMHNVVVGHDSHLLEGCVVCAGASLGGGVRLEEGCFVGPNGAVAPRVRIAAGSFMAAGSACLRDVPARSALIGNPARAIAGPDAAQARAPA